MKNYIKNRFNMEKGSCVLSIMFWVINFAFMQICLNMFVKVISAGKSNWFDEALKRQVTSDPFIINRTELLMKMLIAVLITIILFSFVSIIFFRSVQLKNMLSQIGMHRILGYDNKRIMLISMLEPGVDMLISFPLSLIISIAMWSIMSKIEVMAVMMKMMDNSMGLNILSSILCVIVMLLVVIVHTKVFIEQSLKKGIRYMLGKGVV